MVRLLRLLCSALIGLFRSSARREAEILVLRQQINVLHRAIQYLRPFSADFITIIAESNFRYRQPPT
jgi:hypothetical protein